VVGAVVIQYVFGGTTLENV